jgi:hypothetical protein
MPSSIRPHSAVAETLYSIKREDKRPRQSVYMKFTLAELRAIANYMRRGVVQIAEIHLNARSPARRPIPEPISPPAPLLRPRKPET